MSEFVEDDDDLQDITVLDEMIMHCFFMSVPSQSSYEHFGQYDNIDGWGPIYVLASLFLCNEMNLCLEYVTKIIGCIRSRI